MKVIVLAGGSGSRLFPLSRECYPKQFLSIGGKESLLQQTVKRFEGLADAKDIVVLTNESYLFIVKQELADIGADDAHIVCEPVGRNTAPAIALAMEYCADELQCAFDEVLFVTPADHMIAPQDSFQQMIRKGADLVQNQLILTMGIVPTKPETGYGYIHRGKACGNGYLVEGFKEKPDKKTAESYMQEGTYYWNSGMFMFRMDTMRQELETYNPEISEAAKQGYTELVQKFSSLPDISIDYAVAEKSKRMAVIPMEGVFWNDIGSFDSISEVLADQNGDTFSGDIRVKDCYGTMILGSDRLICGIGLENVMIVDTPDVLLVAQKGRSQEIKEIVRSLKEDKRKEVEENVTMYRPWGSYTILAEGDGYKVKRITVNPGQKLSLQKHYHRSEHWTVISGTGKCTLDDKTVIFRENESTYIPIGVKHRLENPGKIPLVIIEVQNGKYLGEDDIVRFDDVYGRE